MLADKSKESPVEGLNQLFRISKNADNHTGITRKINSLAEIAENPKENWKQRNPMQYVPIK